MNSYRKTLLFVLLGVASVFTSCDSEDPGPLQERERNYSIIDFDQLELGSSFDVSVTEANLFSIHVKGDRRNIDDLEVYKSGSTLIIKYDENESRNHETYIEITMPRLISAKFSDGSVSTIKGFESEGQLRIGLSGGASCQLDAGYKKIDLDLSGASTLRMNGLGDELQAKLSGASILSAFDFPVRIANVDVSGASRARLTVSDAIDAVASGASEVRYRGNPLIESDASGASTITKD